MSSKYAFLSSENQNDKLNNPIITKNLENILRKCDSDNEEFEVLQERDQNGAKTDRSNSKYQSLMGEYAKAQDTIKILKRKIVQKNENKSCFYFPKIEELQNEPQISDFNNDFNKEGNKRLWSYIFRLQNYIADEVSNNERFKKEIMLEMKEKDQLIQRLSKTKNCNDENIALNKLVGNASPEEIVEILKIRRKKGGFKQFINEKVHLEKENGLLRNELEEIEREKL